LLAYFPSEVRQSKGAYPWNDVVQSSLGGSGVSCNPLDRSAIGPGASVGKEAEPFEVLAVGEEVEEDGVDFLEYEEFVLDGDVVEEEILGAVAAVA
jgi:hypothetical protein